MADPNPSTAADTYWLFARRKVDRYPCDTARSRKWLVFVSEKQVDAVWAGIKQAVEDGRLGNHAKVATARPNPHATHGRRVICVYTYDYEDVEDVRRIRDSSNFGIVGRIPYKSDADTDAGKYRATGYDQISKFFE